MAAALVALLFGVLSVNLNYNFNISETVRVQLPALLSAILTITATILGTIAGIIGAAQLFLRGTVELGYCKFLLHQHDKNAPLSVATLFSQFDRFGQAFLQSFLRALYIFLWSLLFVIPGIVKSYAYAMTPFLMTDYPHLSANEAITLSKEMMDGYKGDLFWLELTFLGWDLLSVFTCGIGLLFLNPYKQAARAVFYRQLLAQRRES